MLGDTHDLALISDSLDDSTLCALIKIIQGLHVFLTEVKVVYICVALDPAGRITLWQRHPALLQAVSDENLSSAFVVSLGD